MKKMKYQFLKFFSCCFVLLTFTANTMAQTDKDKYLQLKNFPFLYMIEVPLQRSTVQPKSFVESYYRILRDVENMKDCKTASCYSTALQFTDSEITAIGNDLVHLVMTPGTVKERVSKLKKSGLYPLFLKEPDTAFARRAWETDARGIAYVLNTYIAGKKPLYPKIDSISFDKTDAGFRDKVAAAIQKVMKNKSGAFFSMSLLFALEALKLNDRDEAARYLPLTAGENAAAFNRVQKIKWKNYSYSAILVPGLGPEQPDVKLDPNGAKRCDSAAVRYREGRAPFIVVSGGHVHPNKTPYCEAIEMKKFLIEKLNIPENAIIIEPHARHTTTNLRNCVRLIYRYGMPFNKACITTTSGGQSMMITNTLAARCLKELNEVPFQNGKRLTETEAEFYPAIDALHINPTEPLDP